MTKSVTSLRSELCLELPASMYRSIVFAQRRAAQFAAGPKRSIFTLKNTQYRATAIASGGGRNGVTKSEGPPPLEIKMGSPKEMGGTGDGHNPEQLFALGYSACFLGALKAVAGQQKKTAAVADAKVHTSVDIGPVNEKNGFGIAVKIEVENVSDHALIQAAHEFCPYSRALSEGVEVKVGPK